MSLKVEHGGYIRRSSGVASGEANWTAGRILALNAVGDLKVHPGTSSTDVEAFVAFDDRVSTGTGPTTTVTKVGAPTGEKVAYLMDETVITMDQNLESGVDFDAGNKLFVSTNGKVTTSGNSTGPNSVVLGVALSDGHAGDTARPLTWFFSVTY
jgi:hypothetical protein